MIDTSKYEGHTEGPWELSPDDWVWAEHLFMQDNTTNFGNAMLITDAPLLLAEVERLRKKLFEAELWVMNDSYTFENDMKELNDYAVELYNSPITKRRWKND